jgi:hypothetical protein
VHDRIGAIGLKPNPATLEDRGRIRPRLFERSRETTACLRMLWPRLHKKSSKGEREEHTMFDTFEHAR